MFCRLVEQLAGNSIIWDRTLVDRMDNIRSQAIHICFSKTLGKLDDVLHRSAEIICVHKGSVMGKKTLLQAIYRK